MPIDWSSPIRYSIDAVLQIVLVSTMGQYLVCFASLAFGSYLFAVTLIGDAVEDLKNYNEKIRTSRVHLDVFKKLSETVQFHGIGKQLEPLHIKLNNYKFF